MVCSITTSAGWGHAHFEVTEVGWDQRLTDPERKETSDPGCPGDGLELVEEKSPQRDQCQEKRPEDEGGMRDHSEKRQKCTIERVNGG